MFYYILGIHSLRAGALRARTLRWSGGHGHGTHGSMPIVEDPNDPYDNIINQVCFQFGCSLYTQSLILLLDRTSLSIRIFCF